MTTNLRDFPEAELAPFGVEAQHPDDFVADLVDADPGRVADVLRSQAADLRAPPCRPHQLINRLTASLPHAMAKLLQQVSGL